MLLLKTYFQGGQISPRTDQKALAKQLLAISEALRSWLWATTVTKIDILHQGGIDHQAADLFSRQLGGEADKINPDDDVPVLNNKPEILTVVYDVEDEQED